MTVAELIAELQKWSPGTIVYVEWGGGYQNEARTVRAADPQRDAVDSGVLIEADGKHPR